MENKNGFLSVVLSGTEPDPKHWRQQCECGRIRATKIEHILETIRLPIRLQKIGSRRSYREISFVSLALTLLVDGSNLSCRNCAKVPEN